MYRNAFVPKLALRSFEYVILSSLACLCLENCTISYFETLWLKNETLQTVELLDNYFFGLPQKLLLAETSKIVFFSRARTFDCKT
jgi:hypothetical protein